MRKARHSSLLVAASAVGALLASPANAAATINVVQSGPDVVATLSGNINGVTPNAITAVGGPAIEPSAALIVFGPTGPVLANGYDVIGPANLGTGGFTAATSASGDLFWLGGPFIVTPSGYVAGSPLAATDTFAGQTFASLGLSPGTYAYQILATDGRTPVDTLTVNIGGGVPEPATWAMMLLGFGAVGFAMHRRKARPRELVPASC